MSIILAESLSQGKGLKDISDIREPFVSGAAPLSLAVLSLFMRYIDEIKPLKILSIINVLIIFWFIYNNFLKVFFNDNDKKIRIYLFLLIIVNPYIHRVVNEITTHLPFLLLYIISLYFLLLYDKFKVNKYLLLAAIFSAFAFLTRWVGLSIFVGTFFYLLIQKKFKPLLLFSTVFLLITGPWLYYTAYLHFSGQAAFLYLTLIFNPYSGGDSGLIMRMVSISIRFLRNLSGYFFRNIPVFIFGDFFEGVTLVNFRVVTILKMVIAFFPSAIIFYGFLKGLRFKSVYFCIIIYGIILGMFAEPDVHYIVPLLVFFYIWGYRGLVSLKANKRILMGVFLLIFSINVLTLGMRLLQREQDSYNVTQWIINNTENKDVFLVYKWFSPLYIYTGRKTIHLLDHEQIYTKPKYIYKEPKEIIEKHKEIKYVLVYFQRPEKQFLSVREMVFNNPSKFIWQYTSQNKTSAIYEVVR